MKKHYKVLNINDKLIVFDYEHVLLFEMDDLAIRCLDQFLQIREESNLSAEEKNVYDQLVLLVEQGLFYSKLDSAKEIYTDFNAWPGTFSFPTVHNCNLRCKYCFSEYGNNFTEEQQTMTYEVMDKVFDFFINDLYRDHNSYRVEFVSGGEPTLNFDGVKMACELRKKYEAISGKKIEIFMCTNGTLLNDDIVAFLDKNNVNIGISLDGDREVNDKNRVFENGKGAYDIVVKNIKKIMNDDRWSRNTKRIWALGVVTAETISLKDILKHHKSIGLQSIQMKIVRSNKDSKYCISKQNVGEIKKLYTELKDYILECIKLGHKDYLNAILNDNDYFGKIIRRVMTRNKVLYRCGAGKTKNCVCANGDLYPCDSFVGNKKFLMGNVFTGIDSKIQEKFFGAGVSNRTKCSDCWIKYLCGGDCYHNSFLVNEDIMVPDEVICEINEHLVVCAFEIMLEIEGDEDLLKYYNKYVDAI